ncbi:MAG: hypothetical protein ACI88A_002417 [Paraglaciecola sp.]|jgi:hypothetical protein
MAIVFELLSRKNKTIQHYKFVGPTITIGRDYANDLRLDDPYVCPKHIQISQQEDSCDLQFEDCDSINGVSVNDKPAHSGTLSANDVIKIGRTRLRIVDTSKPVVSTLRLSALEEKVNWMSSTTLAISLTLAYLMFAMAVHYIGSVEEFKMSTVLPTEIGQMAVFCIWPLMFALLAKVFGKESHIVNQFNLLWIVLFVLHGLNLLEYVLLFNINDTAVLDWIEFLIFAGIIFGLIWFSLFIAFHQRTQRRNIIASLMSMAILLPLASVSFFAEEEFNPRPEYDAPLLPPIYNFSAAQNTESFINESAELFDQVQQKAIDDGS